MNAKRATILIALALVLALGFAACSRARDDAQVASQVQQKIFSDPAVQSRQITVQSANGVVTLSGTVASENERVAAASQAAEVEGVKTVVNNLQVAQAEAPPAPEAQAAAEPEPAARAAAPARRPAPKPRAARRYSNGDSARTTASAEPAPMNMTPAPATPSAPAPPRKVTLPQGTVFSVRLVDALDTETTNVGDTFHATLDSPITIEGEVVVPARADLVGRVVEAKKAGHYAGQSQLALELVSLKVNNNSYTLRTNQYTREGTSRGKQTAKRVGAGAAIGAIIGGIAGGGKGAAIGGAIGAGTGGGVQTATKGEQIKLPSESLLSFQLESPVTVMAATENSTRQRLQD